MEIIGYTLAVFIGIILGLIGSGGSIIAVPVLVYIMHIEPALATAYSLFTVGITALFGALQKLEKQEVAFDKVFLFGIPTMVSVFLTRKFMLPNIPEMIDFLSFFQIKKSVFIMILFALVMFASAIKMILPSKNTDDINNQNYYYFKIITFGSLIGIIAGFVGSGGGFLIIPALVYLTNTPMKLAVGTSLFIIAAQSLLGFLGDVINQHYLDWKFLFTFSGLAIVGIYLGNLLSERIDGNKLKKGFGYFVLTMSILIFVKEIS